MSGKNFLIPTTRLENFSDGVFAIVLTLLAFQFKVPTFRDGASFEQNLHELNKLIPFTIGFVFSFIFIAVFWVNHHHLYHTIKEANSTLLWYNIHSLFWITLIPSAIAMVDNHPLVPLAAICLGVVLFMASVATYLLLQYSYVKSKLVDESLSYESIKRGLGKNLAAIIITFLGIIAAFFSVYISYIIYSVVLIIFMIPHKMEKRIRFSSRRPDNTQDEKGNSQV